MGQTVKAVESIRSFVIVAALSVALLASGPAAAAPKNDYERERAGHPIRVAAYVLHPVGFLLDWVVFRPAWWLGSYQPFRSLFGRTDEDG